jgi:WhiB family redox-sensing transcriptional regulator
MADTHEICPEIQELAAKLQKRETAARYLFAMIDGEHTHTDIADELVEAGAYRNRNTAANALSLMIKEANAFSANAFGEPLIAKSSLQAPYSCPASLVEEFISLRHALLPMDMSAVDPTLFMDDTQQEAYRYMDPLFQKYVTLVDKVTTDLGKFKVNQELVVDLDNYAVYLPSVDLVHIYRTVATTPEGGFSGHLEKEKVDQLKLTSAKAQRLNELSLTLVNEPLLNVTGEISGGRKRLKYEINHGVLARIAQQGHEVALLPSMTITLEELGGIQACVELVNSFINGKIRSVGFVGSISVRDSLLMRQMLEDFNSEADAVAEKRNQLLFMFNRKLAFWSVARKKDVAANSFAHSLVAEGRPDGGACKGTDPDLFFPERGASTREAKEVCRGCNVRLGCLEFAIVNGEKFGIWGGLSERERRRLRKKHREDTKKLKEQQRKSEAASAMEANVPISAVAGGE